MKSKFFCIAFLLVSMMAFSQIEKRTWMAGGSGYLNGGFGGGTKVLNASLQPQIGYFPVKNLGIGLFAPVGFNTSVFYKSWSLGAGTFLRYYVPISENFMVFPHVEYSVSHTTTRQEGFKANTNFTNNINTGFGASWFITKNVAFEPLIGLQADGKGNNSLFGRLGFQLYFNR